MRHRFLAFVLLVCLAWQALAGPAPVALTHGGSDDSHALLHYLDSAHHHHGEAVNLHEEGSAESLAHVMSDACMYSPALISCAVLGLLPPTPAAPVSARVYALPIPLLPGLERPPRLIA